MDDTEKGKFEKNWQGAFGDAEVQPPDSAWTGIEQQLGQQTMRKRLVFYQRLAAACVLFAFLAGAFGLYWRDQHTQLAQAQSVQEVNKTNQPAVTQPTEKSTEPKSNAVPNPATADPVALKKDVIQQPLKTSDESSESASSLRSSIAERTKSTLTPSDNSSISGKTKNSSASKSTSLAVSESTLPINSNENLSAQNELISKQEQESRTLFYGSVADVTETAPLMDVEMKGGPRIVELVRRLPAMPAAFMNREKEKYGEKWWASAGASAGGYNPNSPTAPATAASLSPMGTSLTAPSSSSSNSGTSYSVAVTAAHRISRRWVLQSGMQYMARSIDYTSNFTSLSGNQMTASLADYANNRAGAFSYAAPYPLESRSEYISIPVQAGYMLIDRKFSWLLNSGVSSDIFLRNTLTDLSGQRASFSESAGQSSPYRSVMWSALMSTELSYKLGSHYRLAIVPGMRYSLNQVLKSDQPSQGNPMIWDVGFRFRYIFK